MIKDIGSLIFVFFTIINVYSQANINKLEIDWKDSHRFVEENSTIFIPNCINCQLLNELPFYETEIKNVNNTKNANLVITDYHISNILDEEKEYIRRFEEHIPTQPNFEISTANDKGVIKHYISGLPFIRKNGDILKITSLTYEIHYTDWPLKAKSYVSTSVLENPNNKWYKIAIQKDGVYKIDKSFLISMGIDVTNLNPKHINIYGTGSGRLSIYNNQDRPDDLEKNTIYIKGEEDNSFDDGDYILFHAFGPSKWSYNGNEYRKDTNPYTNSSYYFLCISADEPPLRTPYVPNLINASHIINKYDYTIHHENDIENLVRGGQRFYGEKFDTELSRNFTFNVPNLASNNATMKVSYATRKSTGTGTISFKINGVNLLDTSLSNTSSDGYVRKEQTISFTPSSTINLNITVNRSNLNTIVYLDKIEIFTKRELKYNGGVMYFRSAENISPGQSNKYVVSNAPSDLQIWEVTNRNQPIRLDGDRSGNQMIITSESDKLREYVAFTNSAVLTPVFEKKVVAQDLHGLGYADILIVTAPEFLSKANRLAGLHENDGSSVHVVTTEQVYNEFSGGQKDPTAIRQFAKMFYDRANGNTINQPKNLILFGKGNYDPRGIFLDGDYVPTYQAVDSENPISAFTSDDFFGILDDEESFKATDKMDIGVGRIQVGSLDEADIVLSKIERYITNYHNNQPTYGDWRLKYSLIADDEDTFLINDTEPVYYRLKGTNPEMNATKIYADVYPQQITAGGIRLPEMEEDIDRSVEEGRLVIAYVGHGGVKGAGQERFIDREQIGGWHNPDKLNLFVSATCDFTRADDPEVNSAGEVMLLNPNGGAVALMSTNRSIFYSVNTQVDSSFFSVAFGRDANHRPLTFGEIFRQTKNKAGSSDNKRSFMLIGDPALRLALPSLKVVTDSINGMSINDSNIDTLKALTKVTIVGHIADHNDDLISDYNGILTPSVFDKEKLNKTLGHKEGETSVLDFYTQENVLYRGNVTIENGRFKFSFYVPKDINYQFGKGKISYYAHNKYIDAYGFDTSIVVGGITNDGLIDDTPPVIQAYMNDTTFIDGGITDENPVFLAFLSDNIGINAVGNGIGHDISLVLDGDEANPIILNNYYLADLDSYQSGSVRYQLRNIPEGEHQLKLKAWDVNNNSAEAILNFRVVLGNELEISDVMNYPNPVSDHTTFSFTHNQPNQNLEVEIIISNTSGAKVKTIKENVITEGYKSSTITWAGKSDNGSRLSNGLYLYSIIVTDEKGNKAKKQGKLILY